MLASEFPEFEVAIRRLEKIFTKKLDDETMQAYWGALKDQHLATFKRFVERYERYGKFFPKPSDLRAKEDKLPPVEDHNSLRAAEDLTIRNLEDLRQKDPRAWLERMGDNNAARLHHQFGEQLWYDLPNRCWRV
jgi:hypothetical protein